MTSYVETRNNIISYIKKNKLCVGSRLPPEAQLSVELGVGRLTLREALNSLKNDGIIYSVQGRGTFISVDVDHITDTLNNNFSVTEMIEHSGYKAGVVDFTKELYKADAELAKRLRVDEGSDVLVCSRVRTADDKKVVYSVDYLSPLVSTAFLQLKEQDLSLYNFFEDTCGVMIGNGVAEVMPTLSDAFLSKMLDIEVNSPILELHQLVCSVQGEPLIWAKEYFLPNYFKFYINRRRG